MLFNQLKLYQSGMYAINIQMKSGLKQNYTLESFEIPESLDNYSVLEVSMTFKEIPKFLQQQNRAPSNYDTVNTGIVQSGDIQ